MKNFYIISSILIGGIFSASLYTHIFDKDFGISGREEHGHGKELYAKYGCPSCHGKDGSDPTVNIYPRINNQPTEYIMTQIKAIYSGERASGMSGIMRDSLSNPIPDQDLESIAEFLSRQ